MYQAEQHHLHAAAEKLVARVLLCIGLGAFGMFFWTAGRLMSLERALDIGDVMVLSVFAIFGAFCASLAWRLYPSRAERQGPMEARSRGSAVSEKHGSPASASKRVTVSQGCSTAGVVLLILSVLVPSHWQPVVLLFLGLALLAVAHVLTPCEERIAKLRKARASLRQL